MVTQRKTNIKAYYPTIRVTISRFLNPHRVGSIDESSYPVGVGGTGAAVSGVGVAVGGGSGNMVPGPYW